MNAISIVRARISSTPCGVVPRLQGLSMTNTRSSSAGSSNSGSTGGLALNPPSQYGSPSIITAGCRLGRQADAISTSIDSSRVAEHAQSAGVGVRGCDVQRELALAAPDARSRRCARADRAADRAAAGWRARATTTASSASSSARWPTVCRRCPTAASSRPTARRGPAPARKSASVARAPSRPPFEQAVRQQHRVHRTGAGAADGDDRIGRCARAAHRARPR